MNIENALYKFTIIIIIIMKQHEKKAASNALGQVDSVFCLHNRKVEVCGEHFVEIQITYMYHTAIKPCLKQIGKLI